jgi:hypothetical protein
MGSEGASDAAKQEAASAKAAQYAALKWPIWAFGVASAAYLTVGGGRSWSFFSWHPLLMMLSLPLAFNAALLKKTGGLVATRWHGYMLTASTMLMLAGGYVAYTHKDAIGKAHYTSTHSWLGAAALGGYCMSVLAATITISPDYGLLKSNQQIRLAHKLGGKLNIAVACAATFTGVQKFVPDPTAQAAFGGLLALFAIAALRF